MLWYFNQVLHIPGEPRLVLVSSEEDEDAEWDERQSFVALVEVNRRFFFVADGESGAQAVKGDYTLEQVPAALRNEGSLDSVLEVCSADQKAIDVYHEWHHRAYEAMEVIAGEVVY
ncbi:hypothetical protein FRB97_008359 [Tulasnella sp. 331]|nr:hypothetical protein FRB97_008359 [Tulasnella sp. 331]